MEMAKYAIKKQFNKKRQNLQGLKQEDNIWLEAKNIQLKKPSKKLDQKRYGSFEITKDYWLKNVSAKVTRRINNIQCVQ